jgi:vacuolar protein-sorting-associated protein 4
VFSVSEKKNSCSVVRGCKRNQRADFFDFQSRGSFRFREFRAARLRHSPPFFLLCDLEKIMSAELRERAMKMLKEATAADTDEEYEKALPLYERGIEMLLLTARHERSAKLREMMFSKAKEMITRAESIKDHLKGEGERANAKKTADKAAASEQVDTRLAEALRSAIVVEKPSTTWDDIAGLTSAKQALKEAVELPIKAPQLFSTGRLEPWRGILLYGPPGTGKTQLARAVANGSGESGTATFVTASAADLCSRYVGDSERLVKQLFTIAREQKPCVIFIDVCPCGRPSSSYDS